MHEIASKIAVYCRERKYDSLQEILYFYRSWTGFGIYEVPLERKGDKYTVSIFKAERNEEIYSCKDDEEDKKMLNFLIYSIMLGEKVP